MTESRCGSNSPTVQHLFIIVNKLEEIIAHKREEIRPILPLAEKLRSSALMRNEFRSLEAALTRDPESLAVIAEVKGASPSAGTIREDFDPLVVARGYEEAGASALSVLTDERYFRGKLSYLSRIAAVAGIPVLRKDFIVHEAQIAEAVVAMEMHATSEDIARIVHAHPTLSEAMHEAALAVDKRAIHKAN